MLNIKHKFNQIVKDFPGYSFVLRDKFYWSSTENTIFYRQVKNTDDISLLLHELAHAELGHTDFAYDIELIKIETGAWNYAKNNLATKYEIEINEDCMEDSLDSYRFWLHKRSQCPECLQNGLQTNQNAYSCINCRHSWRVNNSRLCRLRRVRLPIRSQLE